MTTQDDIARPVFKRFMLDLHVQIKMGTPPEDKREIFEDLKVYLQDVGRLTDWFGGVHYSDFFTVAPGVTDFRFIVSAESADAATLALRSVALHALPVGKAYEVFARDY